MEVVLDLGYGLDHFNDNLNRTPRKSLCAYGISIEADFCTLQHQRPKTTSISCPKRLWPFSVIALALIKIGHSLGGRLTINRIWPKVSIGG